MVVASNPSLGLVRALTALALAALANASTPDRQREFL